MDNEIREEQGITFADLWFLVKRNMLLILIVTLVFTVLGGIYGLKIKNPTYTATTTAIVFVDTSSSGSSGNVVNNYSYATYFTSTFSTFIKSNPVLTLACKNLNEKGYEYSRKELKDCISIGTESNSLIITIVAKVSSKDENEGRARAQAIANTILESTIQEANKYKYDSNGNVVLDNNGDPVYEYLVLAEKLVAMEKVENTSDVVYSRGAGTTILIAFLIGLVVSMGIVLVKYLIDDTFSSKETFEKMTGLTVFASIPEIGNNGGDL